MALIPQFELAARRKLRGAAFSIVGVLLILAGAGFLCVALFIVLAELRDTLFATQVIGGGLFAFGLIFLGIGKIISRRPRYVAPVGGAAAALPIAQLIEGFVVGLEAGRRSRRR
ncbi:hypothetical protein LR948_17700 [Roseivivax sp. GX 12232]|uniref:hypothetical protein n=1 Tax=Roseivivax sp. GX 12232 TaxID=2900547 RepID=UPI001E3D01C0|nr:hypothetical protein [Roseivivax sp. GX 12232]MCE0507206.1 hypothetical protein [Roseivivax sp. GX 12232]